MALLKMPTTLKRGVGRKILSLFLLAGLLPVTFTASLAYLEIERGMYEEVGRTLRANAREYGQDMLGRLQQVSAAADDAARMFEIEGSTGLTRHTYLLAQFQNVWFVDAAGGTRSISGYVDADAFDDAVDSARFPNTMNRSVVTIEGEQGSLVFQFDVERIWGNNKNNPSRTDFCVLSTSGTVQHCTAPIADGVYQALLEVEANAKKTTAEWQYDGEAYLGAMWQSTLIGDPAIPLVSIVALQPTSFALQSRADFSRVFIPALILVVILVAALSFAAIGESLTPLQRLTTAVRQITAGNLDARLRIRSNDEFELLGSAFNQMATKLGGQISTLKAMSEIDQQILSGAKFEEVSECVLQHLLEITGYESAAVIARDDDRLKFAKLISAHGDEVLHERIALPVEMGHQWCQPRQVSLDEVSDDVAPYRDRFLSYGAKYVALLSLIHI